MASTASMRSSRERGLSEATAEFRSRGGSRDKGLDSSHPVRMCQACRTRLPQAQLTRWTRQEGGMVPDNAHKLSGRGIYSCSDACAARLAKISKPTKR